MIQRSPTAFEHNVHRGTSKPIKELGYDDKGDELYACGRCGRVEARPMGRKGTGWCLDCLSTDPWLAKKLVGFERQSPPNSERREVCQRGHFLHGDNVYIIKEPGKGRSNRSCYVCRHARNYVYQERRRHGREVSLEEAVAHYMSLPNTPKRDAVRRDALTPPSDHATVD